jgi:hypothetical protein
MPSLKCNTCTLNQPAGAGRKLMICNEFRERAMELWWLFSIDSKPTGPEFLRFSTNSSRQ